MFCKYFGISCPGVNSTKKFTLVFYKSSYCSLWVKTIPKFVHVFFKSTLQNQLNIEQRKSIFNQDQSWTVIVD